MCEVRKIANEYDALIPAWYLTHRKVSGITKGHLHLNQCGEKCLAHQKLQTKYWIEFDINRLSWLDAIMIGATVVNNPFIQKQSIVHYHIWFLLFNYTDAEILPEHIECHCGIELRGPEVQHSMAEISQLSKEEIGVVREYQDIIIWEAKILPSSSPVGGLIIFVPEGNWTKLWSCGYYWHSSQDNAKLESPLPFMDECARRVKVENNWTKAGLKARFLLVRMAFGNVRGMAFRTPSLYRSIRLYAMDSRMWQIHFTDKYIVWNCHY